MVTFQPGQSGNPGGRKPIPEELKNRLRNLSAKAVDALENALNNPDDRVRISAATVLLDRAYGKPAQQADLNLKADTFDPAAIQIAALLKVAQSRGAEPRQDEDTAPA